MPKNEPVELKSRLTLKEMGCKADDVLKMAESPANRGVIPELRLAHIYGQASRCGVQADKNTGQEFVYFIGTFEGVNLQTGEVTQSSKLYLPPGASETLEDMINRVQDRRKGAIVNFAFEIVSVPSDETRSGIAYKTRTILQPEQSDMLGRVRDVVKQYADKQDAKEKTKPGKSAAA